MKYIFKILIPAIIVIFSIAIVVYLFIAIPFGFNPTEWSDNTKTAFVVTGLTISICIMLPFLLKESLDL